MSEEVVKFENNQKNINLMGVNIDISTIIGNKLAEQWIGGLDEEHTKLILDFLTNQYFEIKTYDWQDLKVKTKENDQWNTKVYPLDQAKAVFAEKTKEELLKKVNAIIESKSYQDELDKIADELITYAIEGYKEDLKKELRVRLVDNVLSPTPEYGGRGLYGIVNDIISSRFNSF